MQYNLIQKREKCKLQWLFITKPISFIPRFISNIFFQISVVDEKREETITRINSKLPSCIKVQSIKKVTKNFNCKSACDSRTYLYLLPTFAFAPILPINELKPNEEEVSPEVYKVTYAYRMPSEVRNYVNEILLKFVGSKYYHNYTSGK